MSQNTDPISPDPNGSNISSKPQTAPGGDDEQKKNSDPYDLTDADVRADISDRIDKALKADAFSRVFTSSKRNTGTLMKFW